MSAPQDVVQSTETPAGAVSVVTPAEWAAMQAILQHIYAYRTEEGDDPSKLFHKRVNKRMLPDYYDVIKEPIALSIVKAKIANKQYQNFKEYVRDFALIPHNAQVYNRPESGAYIDALILKEVLQSELQKLVDSKLITQDTATLPFLGDIPIPDELPPVEDAEGEEEEEDEDEEEDEEEEDTDEEGAGRKKKRGRRSLAALKRENSSKFVKSKGEDDDDADTRKRRGRPPKVDTPMEARIRNIMKNMRRPKNSDGQYKLSHFDRLPDKATLPDYYNEIKDPMAMDVIKKKIKRKKYHSIDQFMKDVELMFENAKLYNVDDSQIYKDAVELQKETRVIAAEEKAKPDADYAQEDGRVPLPDGILHNGELWKVGDWVHILNANDLTKPIVAQIYRTWQDTEGAKWVNACWYYRPEQTVHRFDRHFLDSEVVKTGQYRDHPIDEIIDRCFVMFITRFNKGRPRNFPADKEVYVCESRYNEEKHKLNKIKTWASCLPDEVRDKDYEMDLFVVPKRMRKVPSPIKYLFKEDQQKEGDDMPAPVWGAPNAPPKIGAVHTRPRDPKDSPPPEPTPSPPPAPPPAAIAPPPASNQSYSRPSMGMSNGPSPMPPSGTPSQSRPSSSYNHPQQYHQHSASPAPSQPNYQQSRPTPNFNPPPLTPSAGYGTRPMPTPVQGYNAPQHSGTPGTGYQPQHSSSYNTQQYSHLNNQHAQTSGPTAPQINYTGRSSSNYPSATNGTSAPGSTQTGYNVPNPVEIYRLPDNADSMIPPDIRTQFHTDAEGHVLFFTVPPAQSDGSFQQKIKTGELGHSAKYLAWKIKREEEMKRMQAERGVKRAGEAVNGDSGEEFAIAEKRRRIEERRVKVVEEAQVAVTDGLIEQYKALFGEEWRVAAERIMQSI